MESVHPQLYPMYLVKAEMIFLLEVFGLLSQLHLKSC